MIKSIMRNSFSLIELLLFTLILSIVIVALEPINQMITQTNQHLSHETVINFVANELESDAQSPAQAFQHYTITYETTTESDYQRIKAIILENGQIVSVLETFRVTP